MAVRVLQGPPDRVRHRIDVEHQLHTLVCAHGVDQTGSVRCCHHGAPVIFGQNLTTAP
jgi:hypothetical protein